MNHSLLGMQQYRHCETQIQSSREVVCLHRLDCTSLNTTIQNAKEGVAEDEDYLIFDLPIGKAQPRQCVELIKQACFAPEFAAKPLLLKSLLLFVISDDPTWSLAEQVGVAIVAAMPGLIALEVIYQVYSSSDWRVSPQAAKEILTSFEGLPKMYKAVIWIDGHARQVLKCCRRVMLAVAHRDADEPID